MAAKVKYGLKNAYYAVATINSSTGAATFGTPVRIPGAVSLSLEPAGEQTVFYADDIAYYTAGGNIGYTGELEVALIPDSFREDCLGEDDSVTGTLIEMADASPKPFALLFEFSTDDKAIKHVVYNCVASRTNISGQTKAESTEVQTETISITASPVYNATLDGNIVKAKADETASAYSSWYTSVWQPTPPTPGQ